MVASFVENPFRSSDVTFTYLIDITLDTQIWIALGEKKSGIQWEVTFY